MPLPKRVRELSDDEIQDLKTDLRWLLSEGGWNFRGLSQALGFAPTANALRNILYDKTGRLGTTRARYEAAKRLRAESLPPGTVLIEAKPVAEDEPQRGRRGRRSKTVPTEANGADDAAAATAASPRTRRGRNSTRTAAGGAASLASLAISSPALLFKFGATEFSAEQQDDGTWRVVITANCSSEQMATWAKQVMDDGLHLAAVTPAAE